MRSKKPIFFCAVLLFFLSHVVFFICSESIIFGCFSVQYTRYINVQLQSRRTSNGTAEVQTKYSESENNTFHADGHSGTYLFALYPVCSLAESHIVFQVWLCESRENLVLEYYSVTMTLVARQCSMTSNRISLK